MPTVFPEDLLNTVIAADALRRQALGHAPSRYRPSQRFWIEPFFNFLGLLWGRGMDLLPFSWRCRLDLWLCQKMSGHAPEANPKLPALTAQTVELARALQQKTGQWPAFLGFTSHPETIGSLEWLRFELLRQGLQVANAVAQANPHPGGRRRPAQCFLAIDPFALDTVTPAVGGFYAAWMHHIYMAWDRQCSTQSWLQRTFFLRGAGYDRIAWRILRQLKHHVPILMVLSGGLPQNARLLYTAREFVQRLKPSRWPLPKRAAEKKLMEILMKPVQNLRPAEKGELPDETLQALQQFLQELGMPETERERMLTQFKEEFRYAVPYRQRLFSVLVNRLVRKGEPLLLLAVSHADAAPYIKVSPAWGLYQDAGGNLQEIRGSLNATAPVTDVAAMAKDFVVSNFG